MSSLSIDEAFVKALMFQSESFPTQSTDKCQEGPFPILSWNSSNCDLVSQMRSAKNGVMILKDLNIPTPMVGARETFCKLYQSPDLVNDYINKLNPVRGLFKNKAFLDKSIDQKIMFDLSPAHIAAIQDQRLITDQGFYDVVDFYKSLQIKVIPRLLTLAANAITREGIDTNGEPRSTKVLARHFGLNQKLRLVDYFPVQGGAQRCGEHRDYTTFTLIFQDRLQGGLEVLSESHKWIPVPPETEVVLMWGWSSCILSNGRLPAASYKVEPLKGEKYKKIPRRNEIVVYVSPDYDTSLSPPSIFPNEPPIFNMEVVKNLTLRDFKTRFELKWHQREGTTTSQETRFASNDDESNKTSQDEDIVRYLFSMGIPKK